MSGFWGAHTYGSGDRVPMKAARCNSVPPTKELARRHTCRHHESHEGPHRCICGTSWPKTNETER